MMNNLGFDKEPKDTRVVVAMSGGVDSSVVAAMLAGEGYDVVGITLQLYDYGMAMAKKGACCAGQDIYDAKMVAEDMGFPHYILNYENKFKENVIDDFADSYLKGRTPIPCVRCNQTVKFKDLLATAKELNADCMATGHYIRRDILEDGKAALYRAEDEGRDQSYFLFATTQEQLDYLRFPLGGMPKSEVRLLAKNLGLDVADKPDSQDICFVPDGDYTKLVRKLRPQSIAAGNIIDLEGNILGKHKGIIAYTIGQRRGLNLGGLKEPLYVVEIKPETNEVIAGPHAALARDDIRLYEVNWLGDLPPEEGMNIQLKIRSIMAPVSGHIRLLEDDSAQIILDEPQYGISPGQACVFYDNNRLCGGGWIKKTTLKMLNENKEKNK